MDDTLNKSFISHPKKTITEDSLIQTIYSAILRPDGYQNFLVSLCQYLNCQSATMITANTETGDYIGGWIHGVEPEIMRLYFEQGCVHDDPISYAVLSDLTSSTKTLQEVSYYNEYKDSSAWLLFGKPQDIVDVMGSIVNTETPFISTLFLQRNSQQGIFEEHELKLFDALKPHLNRSLKLFTRFQEKKINQQPLIESLDMFKQPVLIFNMSAKILFSNQAAKDFTNKEFEIKLEPGTIQFREDKLSNTFNAAFYETSLASIGQNNSTGEVIHTGGKPNNPILFLQPLSTHDSTDNILHGGAILFIYTQKNNQHCNIKLLKEIFHLSPAETDICLDLLKNKSPEKIAELSNRSINTIRTHIKNIYAKTGTSKQSELLCTLLCSPAFLI